MPHNLHKNEYIWRIINAVLCLFLDFLINFFVWSFVRCKHFQGEVFWCEWENLKQCTSFRCNELQIFFYQPLQGRSVLSRWAELICDGAWALLTVSLFLFNQVETLARCGQLLFYAIISCFIINHKCIYCNVQINVLNRAWEFSL